MTEHGPPRCEAGEQPPVSRITLHLPISHLVCLGVEPLWRLCSFEISILPALGVLFWWKAGPALCQNARCTNYIVAFCCLYTFPLFNYFSSTQYMHMACTNPGFVQQYPVHAYGVYQSRLGTAVLTFCHSCSSVTWTTTAFSFLWFCATSVDCLNNFVMSLSNLHAVHFAGYAVLKQECRKFPGGAGVLLLTKWVLYGRLT